MSMETLRIIVPDTSPSTRFPGKNKILWKYTREYVEACPLPAGMAPEILVVHNPRTDYTGLGIWPDIMDDEGNSIVRHVCDRTGFCSSMERTLEFATRQSQASIHVLLQLTQPVRRPGLLTDAVQAVQEGRNDLVTSYVEWMHEPFRHLDSQEKPGPAGMTCLYDGAVYAWRGTDLSWVEALHTDMNYLRNCAVVWNYTGPVCDIDYPWQYSDAYIRGLQVLADTNWKYELQ